MTAWTLLVRYQPSPEGPVQFGEPIISDEQADIDTLMKDGQLQVKICEGSDLFNLQVGSQVQTVYKLLGPLEQKSVPIIRCIGLNYKSHRKSSLLPAWPRA